MESYFLSQSCFCHIPLASLRSPSSFLYTSLSVSFNPVRHRRKKTSINIFHEEEDSADDCNFCRRKSVMLSLIPVFKLNSEPLQGLPSADHIRKMKQMLGSHSLVSILIGFGILGSIAFAVIYALARNLRNENTAIRKSMQTDLNGVYDSLVSMEMDFVRKMLNVKEEEKKQIMRIHKEKFYLVDKIRMARKVLADLGRDLMMEKDMADNLTFQIQSTQSNIFKINREKKELRAKLSKETYYFEEHRDAIMQLRSKIKDKRKTISDIQLLLPQKEIQLVEMNTSIREILTELNCSHREVKIQKKKLLRSNSELKTAHASFTNLTAQIISLSSERDNANIQSNNIHTRIIDLESSSNLKQAARSKLLSVIDCETLYLKEQVDIASTELTRNQILESDLIQERDELKKLIDRESDTSKNLQSRLQIMEETVKESRKVAFHIVSQLQQSESLWSQLKNKLVNTRAEFADSKDSLEKKLNELNSSSDVTKTSINKARLQLAASSELAYFHDKAKKIMELERKQRETVEEQLVAANKSVDEMKKNMLLLSEELPLVNSRIDGLKNEINGIVSLMEEEKVWMNKATKEMEYANSIVERLRGDRTELMKECEKLEEELALAKGKILVERNED